MSKLNPSTVDWTRKTEEKKMKTVETSFEFGNGINAELTRDGRRFEGCLVIGGDGQGDEYELYKLVNGEWEWDHTSGDVDFSEFWERPDFSEWAAEAEKMVCLDLEDSSYR